MRTLYDSQTFKPQYYVCYDFSWKNLNKYQDISSLMIIFLILINGTFDQVLILLGESRCLSLLGLKMSQY